MKTLKQLLELKAEKPTPSTPVEPDSVTSFVPKTKDEKRFMDKHVVQKHADRAGNGDDVYRATNVKAYDRAASKHGYNPKQDQDVYESKTLQQIMGERHMTPAEMDKRENIARGIEKSNPGMAMPKKMAIATSKAMGEGVDADQLDEAARHDQYKTYHTGVKGLLKSISQHADLHKEASESPTEWSKEKGGNMHMGHVSTIKNLHRTLQDINDSLQQEVEYAKPPKPLKMKEETNSLFDVFAEDLRPQIEAVYGELDDANKQIMIEMIEAEDYDTVVEIVKEMNNG